METFRDAFNYTVPLYYPQGFTVEIAADAGRTILTTVDVHTNGNTDRVAAWLASSEDKKPNWTVSLP